MNGITAAVLTALAVAGPASGQSPAGKWLGDTPDGASIGLDLTVTGSALSGSFVLMREGQLIPIAIREGTMTGDSFTFSVVAGNDAATFLGEHSGDRITLRNLAPDPSGPPIVLNRVDAFPSSTLDPITTAAPASAPAGWRSYNRAATLVDEGGRSIVRVDARLGDGVIWQAGSNFREGTIEVEMRGRNAPGESFVGIAFRGTNDRSYDAVYFRPFNFRADEPGRQRAVQYVSHPDHAWARLRAERPGHYESAISPVPDPEAWFRARIVVEGQRVSVFVDDAAAPTLAVDALTEPRGGMVGLWVGNGSGGDFANLRLIPKVP